MTTRRSPEARTAEMGLTIAPGTTTVEQKADMAEVQHGGGTALPL